ncbi:hypothetical protein I302_106767 [Kwoniella bestiolae CBS 10118]|uniref:Aminoglycoside phosphotransferase domain-containing protein n=1 Tax=Kwoniella bestiolae CBS 10118 TaxID=1296100 RepID=A0A1B9G0G8_9TREE|nr:hypothetical protein I302_05967 [Kwoniella bestiolae CBS 10118]OCF24507.1 hypothetical protein I302_05967 [Kwoniella bestiolae CBS 10118]
MGPSLQPPINRITPRRRFLESRNPSTGGRIVIKRSTTPEEASIPLNRAGTPAERTERSFSSLQNEALALGFLERYTKIPIPKVTAFFEDRSCLYLIQGYVEDAIPAIDTPSHLHPHITRQLERYMSQIHNIRSETLHSFTKEVHLPARLISTKAILCNLQYPQDPQSRYVLCHGDLGWQNVMVDPKTGDIKAIIDWEYSGFYPIEVEGDYWRRWWTARHRGYEISDVDQVSRLLYNLSTNKAFETGYALDRRINYVKKTKDQPAGEDEDRSHRWYRRLSTRLRKSDTDAAGKTTSPQGRSTFHVQNGEVDVQETTPNIPSGENETGQSSQPAKPTEESDAPGWADLTVSHPKEDTVTARSLALQVAIASRENLAKRLVSLKRSLDIDYRATQDWTLAFTRDAPLYYKANLKRKTLLHGG